MRLGRKLAEGFAADPDADRAVSGAPEVAAEPLEVAREHAGFVPDAAREPEPAERPAGV